MLSSCSYNKTPTNYHKHGFDEQITWLSLPHMRRNLKKYNKSGLFS